MDIMTPTQRHRAMANNRGRTGPERALASALWREGLRFFTHDGYRSVRNERLVGKPDLVFPRKRVVVFVDGCFWHGCPQCRKHSGLTSDFWIGKISANRERDTRVTAQLEEEGWTVIRVPEHDVRSKAALAGTVERLTRMIRNAPARLGILTMESEIKALDFVLQDKPSSDDAPRTAVSLFSGAGLSDLGYQLAGFQFVVQVESDERRADVGADNFPESTWLVNDVRESGDGIAQAYAKSTSQRLDLLVATPPCQGMSSSNPSRGKRQTPRAKELEKKNGLMLEVIPVAERLNPRIIVAENVRPVLTLEVGRDGHRRTILNHLEKGLPNYQVFSGVVNVADYGVPQIRRRAVVVAVHKDESWLGPMLESGAMPLPRPTHTDHPDNGTPAWVSLRNWIDAMKYERLDASCKEEARGADPLHFVPAYGADRYMQVSQIPPHSGRSAYENDTCPSCQKHGVELKKILCNWCGAVMKNRPYVERDGKPSLIKGFHSSYRRMSSDRPAYTITTNTSHVGSDFKIHPWENRVLSILECADLQTVPRFYDWTRPTENRTPYLIRQLVGEAFPTYFTYLHGQALAGLLSNPDSYEYDQLLNQ